MKNSDIRVELHWHDVMFVSRRRHNIGVDGLFSLQMAKIRLPMDSITAGMNGLRSIICTGPLCIAANVSTYSKFDKELHWFDRMSIVKSRSTVTYLFGLFWLPFFVHKPFPNKRTNRSKQRRNDQTIACLLLLLVFHFEFNSFVDFCSINFRQRFVSVLRKRYQTALIN